MKIFSSIYIGSNEVIMKIYEISKSKGIREVDRLRKPVSVWKDIYELGKIGLETKQELIRVLLDMKHVMESYRCDDYRLRVTEALDAASNKLITMDQIRVATGLEGEILTNSEHRFLVYEALASTEGFSDIIKKGAVIVDISGNILQVTIFKNGKMETTQHVMAGLSTVAAQWQELHRISDRSQQIMEVMQLELDRIVTMYMGDESVEYLCLLGEHASAVVQYLKMEKKGRTLDMEQYRSKLKKLQAKSVEALINDAAYMLSNEGMVEAFLLMHRCLAEAIPAANVFVPGVTIAEGIAWDYAYSKDLLEPSHDFEDDVMAAAWYLAERYNAYLPHLQTIEKTSAQIFDAMKKYHGLSKRSRLLLRVAAVLHDCGKYISISESAACSETIIMSTEILGLTHQERIMVAKIVAWRRGVLPAYDEVSDFFTTQEYITIRKLVVILDMANTLDRSHKQKYANVSMKLDEGKLIISLEAKDSMTLEKGSFAQRAEEFIEVFSVTPVIRERKASGGWRKI